jgi:alpha-ketoglutaric semialdehyde dehydrogenase
MAVEQVLVAGGWRDAKAKSTFHVKDPATGETFAGAFPVSEWQDCEDALNAAVGVATELRAVPAESLADFLDFYAKKIEENSTALVTKANAETGLAAVPRLRDVELPRTSTQLRQGAGAAREGSWTQAVIDTKSNIRSHYAPIGPVVIFGPNNFPFAFNGISGGDLTAAIATGNPVIAKANPLHPGTSKLLAECAVAALAEAGLPPSTLQMIYRTGKEDGLRLVSDSRVGAVSFTGSREAGLRLKAAAESAGNPIYLEMSSLNPVILLPGALAERGEQLATELADSCLAASGQFCTSPNLILMIVCADAEKLATNLATILDERPPAPLLSAGGLKGLDENVRALIASGATVVTGAESVGGCGFRYKNTLLRTTATQFLANPEGLQREAFGNATMVLLAENIAELRLVIQALEGNLTGSIYSSKAGVDDSIYGEIASDLRFKVGRLLNDKMPTGVALSPAMNHGGPYPATGHPGFTAVGIPASLLRFGALHCYDNVRPDRLPAVLQDKSPNPAMWRRIDGNWTRG